jgi:hypothetical protein
MFSGMQTDDVRGLKVLEAENATLKRIVANQALELEATWKLLRGNGFRPPSAGWGWVPDCRTAHPEADSATDGLDQGQLRLLSRASPQRQAQGEDSGGR